MLRIHERQESTSSIEFDLTNQTTLGLIGLRFKNLETDRTYIFTSIGDGLFCLVSDTGTVWRKPATSDPGRRVTASFISMIFGTNDITDYWKFVIPNENPARTPTLIRLHGVKYEF